MSIDILQISDPHLMSQTNARVSGIRTHQTLHSVLNAARQIHGTPDRIVISGDLCHEHTNIGYRKLKKALNDWTERSSFIPGNHDDRQELINVFPQQESDAKCVTFRIIVGNWQIIGLDSQSPGNVFGELSRKQLQLLSNWIADEHSRPTMIFIHHPPISMQTPWLDTLILKNPDELVEVIKDGNVRAIFCGHVHQEYMGELAGVPVYTTPSTAFQFKLGTEKPSHDTQPPGWRSIKLIENTFTTEIHRLQELGDTPGF